MHDEDDDEEEEGLKEWKGRLVCTQQQQRYIKKPRKK